MDTFTFGPDLETVYTMCLCLVIWILFSYCYEKDSFIFPTDADSFVALDLPQHSLAKAKAPFYCLFAFATMEQSTTKSTKLAGNLLYFYMFDSDVTVKSVICAEDEPHW